MRALVLGASGQISRAVARDLLALGLHVDAVTRDGRPLPAEIAAARHVGPARRTKLIAAVAYDPVIDPIAFTSAEAAELLTHPDAAGAFCAVSSASVYADDAGRGFETQEGFPDDPDPILKDQRQITPW